MLFFAFCLSITASLRAMKKQKTQHESHTKIERNSTTNRSRIEKKSMQIDLESTKIRSWPVWGAQSRSGDALGCACDGPRSPKSDPRSGFGAPRARQERPGIVQKSPWVDPQTLPDCSGAVSQRFGASKGVEHNHGTIFCRFCIVARKPRCAFRISFYSVLSTSS